MAARRRVDSVVWFMRLSAQARSGVSARVYCRRHGWSYSTFMTWRQRLCRELAGGLAPRFVAGAR
jgi:hypothetical protein